MSAAKQAQFGDLSIGDTFDFIGPNSFTNSYKERCVKVTTRGYTPIDKSAIRMNVGSISAKVYHVSKGDTMNAKQAQRTPGPWSDSGMTGEEGCVYADGETLVAECSNLEDTQFIVRACNSHDDLLAALKQIHAVTYAAPANERCNRAHEIARAAIAKAEA